MISPYSVRMALLALLAGALGAEVPRVVGDGVHDDTAGLQALLDARTAEVRFPAPPVCLLISRTLVIHNGQALIVPRYATIRLKAQTGAVMITNADHDRGNQDISLTGGIWDMDNLNQPLTAYQQDRRNRGTYTPDLYTGVLMRFRRVSNLRLANFTLKDPVTFGAQLADVRQFSVEDVTFDYNLKRNNMDGVHVNGPATWGRIANLKGTTNDDLVALNADDGGWAEMSRGPIEGVSIDGIYSENGFTAVRLLSCGSPVRRIQISNVFGTYRYNVVSFTNHQVHPGAASTFEDVSIRDVFCSKAAPEDTVRPKASSASALIWIDAPAVVSALTISGLHRTESALPADNIRIEAGATVGSLHLRDISLINKTSATIPILTNRGTIEDLFLSGIDVDGAVSNFGTIRRREATGTTR